jgi:Ribbon-helix-helix protein, copG family
VRTTITLADDVAAAVQHLMQREGVGRSEAVNSLVRAGLAHQRPPANYEPRTFPMAIRVDVADIGEVLDLLDQWDDADGREAPGAG